MSFGADTSDSINIDDELLELKAQGKYLAVPLEIKLMLGVLISFVVRKDIKF